MAAAKTRQKRSTLRVLQLSLLLAAVGAACTDRQERSPLIVDVPGRTMSKLPFVIAQDQGLYEKHGLDVELWLPEPEFEGGIETHLGLWTSIRVLLGLQDQPTPDIIVNGHTPQMVRQMKDLQAPKLIALAGTDCSVRDYIIARPNIQSLEELKGQRLGLSSEGSTSGFAGLRLVQRMGWNRDRDIQVVIPAGIEELRQGRVDAIAAGDSEFEAAKREGFPILEDTRGWNEQLAGNSVLVSSEWLQDSTHREAVRRFLMAAAEAVALFHQRQDLVLDVMTRWYGMDRNLAQDRYKRTDYVPRKPFPCIEGVRNTMQVHDSEEMRRYKPEDFYDDSLMRELDQNGFLESLYK